MFPDNSASVFPAPSQFLPPDDASASRLEDFEMGGVNIQDTTLGLMSFRWRCWVVGIDVHLQRDGWAEPVILFQRSNITDIAFTFDQNMRPCVAYRATDGILRLRWYDSSAQEYRTDEFGVGRNPKLTLDDKRTFNALNSDMVFAYIANANLAFRLQRDRFGVEYILKPDLADDVVLKSMGMGMGLRLQFELA